MKKFSIYMFSLVLMITSVFTTNIVSGSVQAFASEQAVEETPAPSQAVEELELYGWSYNNEVTTKLDIIDVGTLDIKSDDVFYYEESMTEEEYKLRKKEQQSFGAVASSVGETANTGLYMSQLSDNALEIYNNIVAAKLNQAEGYTYTYNNNGTQYQDYVRGVKLTYASNGDAQSVINALAAIYADAMWAYLRDNQGSMAWATNRIYIGFRYSETTVEATVMYGCSEYYSSTLQTEIDNVVQNVMEDAPKGRYEAYKYFHDWIINNNEYDNTALSATQNSERYYQAHSQVGCMVKGTGVCESYAKTFKVFCEKAGLPCLIVSSDTHAWNLVQMEDGNWYMIDCTWDEPVSVEAVLKYEYFLVNNNPFVDGDHTNDNLLCYPMTSSTNYIYGASVTPTPAATPTPALNKCGDYLTWSIDTSERTLTIDIVDDAGNGVSYDMYDYEEFAPWHDYKEQFDTVEVGTWVSKLGNNAFYDCTNIKTLSINGSSTGIKNVESLMYKDDAGQLKWIDDITVVIPARSEAEKWALSQKAPGFKFNGDTVCSLDCSIFQTNEVGMSAVLFYEAPGLTLGYDYTMTISMDGEIIEVYDDMYSCNYMDNWFSFPAKVSAKDMSKKLTFTFKRGANKETPGILMCDDYVASVDDFIKQMIVNEANSGQNNELWGEAIATGLAIETYFGVRSKKSADSLLKEYIGDAEYDNMQIRTNNVDKNSVIGHKKNVYGEHEGVTYLGTSLVMLDSTTIRHYFKIDSNSIGGLPALVNDKEVALKPVVEGGDIYTIEIKNVVPKDYFTMYNTYVGNVNINYSVGSYIYDVLNKNNHSGLSDVVKRLYLYSVASTQYWQSRQ